jgi:hypothetical protein
MTFDSAMSQVQAASQASAATMGQLRDVAIKAGADTQYSAVEAAQGITEMAKAGVSAADIMKGGLAGALNLAAAGQISVADAAETGATALSVFRLEGNKMSHVADLLAAGAGKAQGSVGDMSAGAQPVRAGRQPDGPVDRGHRRRARPVRAQRADRLRRRHLVQDDAAGAHPELEAGRAGHVGDRLQSAYDAQGNFIGLQNVAEQLRTGLSGLSEEQRNATLKTIFGSDAVRAAAVLYKEGASGVAEWARNDQRRRVRAAAGRREHQQPAR